MMQGSRISANQNSWVVSVFPTFTGSGSFPSIPVSSPVTVQILQSVAVHSVSGSTPGRTMKMVEPVSTRAQQGCPLMEQRR
ncbi:unnamed protein product [Merluccius merluccius]